jgi:hypothetical protein
MDHQAALRRLRSTRLLRTALAYAIFDRVNLDWFFDPIEIEYVVQNREGFLADLAEELHSPAAYEPLPAIAFFPPKNKLCDRRMVYVPIKDLTVRYALAILFSEEIETEIHPQCFANRRATGAEAAGRFTQDFARAGWAEFCKWQHEQSACHPVLLRTDISAFYDSISHEYLVDAICRHLALPRNSDLVCLFHKLLRIPVIYYSPSNNHVEGPAIMHQGLPIGDGVEGFFANILLKDIDDAMAAADATYGRYVDDIRLFGQTRHEVMQRLRILQEQLLRKGLNLNSSKTEIAEDRVELEHLVSQNYALADYCEDEPAQAGIQVASHIDQPFETFSRVFLRDEELGNSNDARDFCKYLSARGTAGQPLVPIGSRRKWHVDRLREIITLWRGPCKHAGWLLVQTATYRGIPAVVQRYAMETVLELAEDGGQNPYARYRILHHLLKLRIGSNGNGFRFLENLSSGMRRRLMALIPSLLSAPAFELNLIGLYMAHVDGRPPSELRRLVTQHATKPCQPLRNALRSLGDKLPEPIFFDTVDEEPDEVPVPY